MNDIMKGDKQVLKLKKISAPLRALGLFLVINIWSCADWGRNIILKTLRAQCRNVEYAC